MSIDSTKPASATGNASAVTSASPSASPTIAFLDPPVGELEREKSPDKPSRATYKIDKDTITAPTLVTVLATAKTAASPPRMAGAHIVVLPAKSSAGGSCGACVTECALAEVSPLLMMIALLGALGGAIHGASSFAIYVGNRELVTSWTWWYLFRPLAGAGVCLVVYLVYRAGFGGTENLLSAADCIKVAGFAGLIGLFAEQASLKLKDIFETVFTPRRDPRGDKASSEPAGPTKPRVDSATASKVAGGNSIKLRILGANFAKECAVTIGTLSETPKWLSATELEIELTDPKKIPDKWPVTVAVVNAPPKGDVSNSVSAQEPK
jgi:hypothetical protein